LAGLVNIRSAVIPSIRLQKRIRGILTEKAALSEEKRLLAELTRQITKLEARGETWDQLIARFILALGAGKAHLQDRCLRRHYHHRLCAKK
jgi:hypothetical protein